MAGPASGRLFALGLAFVAYTVMYLLRRYASERPRAGSEPPALCRRRRPRDGGRGSGTGKEKAQAEAAAADLLTGLRSFPSPLTYLLLCAPPLPPPLGPGR